MKRILQSGEQLCRTFTSGALVLETNRTMSTVDIDTERQIIDLKRKLNDVRNHFVCTRFAQQGCFVTILTLVKIDVITDQSQDNKGH